ncbi:hypothetical protein NDU88_005902 [Pleurodeles waltl]|uniref:Uncharacterized protein n=1 Tax=Pleurodeles waltl TaxID=8319 RepID=A0AAV7UKB3_PLEWA|nr:hypothetical protein NDU88_005902 [Pleurodeles waltl]
MVRNKWHPLQQLNKMDKYTVPRQTRGSLVSDSAEGGHWKDQDPLVEPSLGAIMTASQDLRGSLEPKLDAVTVDVTLLRADLRKSPRRIWDPFDLACTLWEAFKTLIRGHTENMIGGQKKELNMQAVNLKRGIATPEACFATRRVAEDDLQHQLRLKRYELRALAEYARAHALATQRQLYDVGDKSDKLLAWLNGRDLEKS